ncbi:MAG: hypothetical protein Q7R39_09635 [Dehalococcoidia bacterium]|nr:hypothetical protein [Dehalococcoidia bacterium]
MIAAYSEVVSFVQFLAPTWRKPQHTNFAQLVCALLERGSLVISDLARAMPLYTQTLHGRLKRIDRFLDNPRLDESLLFLQLLRLAYRFGDDLPPASDGRPILPLLLDTVYFEPFALLVFTVPCGSRGLPVALTTYHRYQLEACFPPTATWPSPLELPPPPGRGRRVNVPSSTIVRYDSQNQIEGTLITYMLHLASPALCAVIVADRGFARAALFLDFNQRQQPYVIRFDAETHIRVPQPLAPGLPTEGLPKGVLGLRPGQRVWCPLAYYTKEDQVPIRLFAVWDPDQKDPWYIATNLDTPEQTERLYRWRMRLECANRDEKTGVILREGGDEHALTSLLHLHRLLLAVCTAEWLCALVGLQAWRDLPEQFQTLQSPERHSAHPSPEWAPLPAPGLPPPLPVPQPTILPEPTRSASPVSTSTACPPRLPYPEWASDPTVWDLGPSAPPPVLPHRGPTPKLPAWLRLFAARGWLSYVRLGKEIIFSVHFHQILHRMVRWLASYLWPREPAWRPWQLRYRIRHWWFDSS